MSYKYIAITSILLLTALAAIVPTGSVAAQPTDTLRLAYFQGGEYVIHSQLRDEFLRQLRNMLPDSITAAFVPEGYFSAEWNRSKCRVMAADLVRVESADMVVTMGPWVVEDLIRAGFTRPIIAMHRFDPYAEGIVDTAGRPIRENLTVQAKPSRLANDFSLLNQIVTFDTLGFLYFPSNEERDSVISRGKAIGDELDFEVVSAEGYDREDAFAFFKAYAPLARKIDVLYVSPLWGLDLAMSTEFFAMGKRDRTLTVVYDGSILVTRGASLCNAGYSHVPDAIFNAKKVIQILEGATPADLPVDYDSPTGLTIHEAALGSPRISLPREMIANSRLVPKEADENVSTYDLPSAISRVLSLNPGYLSRQDRVEAAAAAASQASSAYLPQVDISASANLYDRADSDNWDGMFDGDRYRATLRLRQTVLSLEALREMKTADKETLVEETRLEESRLDLELALATAYLDYLKAQERMRVIRDNRDRIDRILELAEAREQMLDGRIADRLRWEQQRHEATAAVLEAQATVKAARVALNVLFNLPGDSRWNLDEASFSGENFWADFNRIYRKVSTSKDEVSVLNQLVDVALREHPTVDVVDARIDVGESRLSRNRARLFPEIGFQARLNWADSLRNSGTFEEDHTTWSLGAELRLPLFEGLNRKREASRFKAEVSALEYRRDQVRLEIMGRTRGVAHRFIGNLGRMPLISLANERSQNNLALVMEQYEQDEDALAAMLDAQTAWLRSQLALIDGRFAMYYDMASLVHALGISTFERNSTFREVLLQTIQ